MNKPLALIVDDDEDFRESMAALMRKEGFATRSAGTAADAESRLQEEATDVALVDLRLPDGSGSTSSPPRTGRRPSSS